MTLYKLQQEKQHTFFLIYYKIRRISEIMKQATVISVVMHLKYKAPIQYSEMLGLSV